MTFPTMPADLETATVNGVVYVYSLADNAWAKQSTGSTAVPIDYAGNLSAGNLSTSGNLSVTGSLNYDTLSKNGDTKHAIAWNASATPPASPEVGDQWYDTTTDSLYTWFTDGISSFWMNYSDRGNFVKYTASSSAPINPAQGDQWYDTSTDTLYTRIYDGVSSYWVDSLNTSANIFVRSATNPGNLSPGVQWYDTTSDTLYTRITDGTSSYWLSLMNQSPTGLINGSSNVAVISNGNINFSSSGVDTVFAVSATGTNTNGNVSVIGNQTISRNLTVSGNINITTTLNANNAVLNAATLGSTVSGNIIPIANASYNLGTPGLRWGTVYMGDLSLSNGIGDYTIVEGEDDLFLYNNKRNKVYKFALVEVDPAIAPPKKGV